MGRGIIYLESEQRDYEDRLLMEASWEDIKNDKEAKRVFKFINRRKSYIKFLNFLSERGVL